MGRYIAVSEDTYFDFDTHRLYRGGVAGKQTLTRIRYYLFEALAENAPHALTIDQLVEAGWRAKNHPEPQNNSTVRDRIQGLREWLDDIPPELIVTIEGTGYQCTRRIQNTAPGKPEAPAEKTPLRRKRMTASEVRAEYEPDKIAVRLAMKELKLGYGVEITEELAADIRLDIALIIAEVTRAVWDGFSDKEKAQEIVDTYVAEHELEIGREESLTLR